MSRQLGVNNLPTVVTLLCPDRESDRRLLGNESDAHPVVSPRLAPEFEWRCAVTDVGCAPVCLQFEMLTGSLPFQGQNRKDTMTMILK